MPRSAIEAAINSGLRLARELFDTVGRRTFDGVGFTRAAYGEGEQIAHDLVANVARELGLRLSVDAALNLAMTLEGTDPEAQQIIIGSHLDSVPQGGNYDGLAGVLAGLACMAALREMGKTPSRTITLLAIRAEENAWFGAQHIGSRAALGLISPAMLDTARRTDTGRTLAEHMLDAGANLEPIRQSTSLLDRSGLHCYLELHIEQGPVLEELRIPLGIVTGIRGNMRCREIVCRGAYGHSGVVPRALRKDAVTATCELVTSLDALWAELESRGEDLVVTFGKFCTDSDAHAVTSIAGQVVTCFDARSHSTRVLSDVKNALVRVSEQIAARRGVSFEFAHVTNDAPITMSIALQDRLVIGARQLGIPVTPIASGAGHDAGDFAGAGVPSAMIFVRNQNGSHNPRESMQFNDFRAGVRLLFWLLETLDRENCLT